MTFREILIDVRDGMLSRLREAAPKTTTWDINNGLCESFGMEVEYRCDEAGIEGVNGFWMDDGIINHYILEYNFRLYDAECIDGVDEIDELPIFVNAGKKRDQVLRERGEEEYIYDT